MVVLTTSFSAAAHEYWMLSTPFSPAVNSPVSMTLHVGEYFVGNLVGITNTHVLSLRHYSLGADEDLSERVPVTALGELPLHFSTAGTHMLAMDTYPNQITLPAEKFHAYLHDEGLDTIIKARQAAGVAETPGRERYRRNVKTLIRVGGRSDKTYAVRTHQRLQLVPLVDPFKKRMNDALDFVILFDGTPLSNALVKAWYKHDDQTVLIRASSDAAGKVRFTLPYAGEWMLSVVHMIPATDSADVDWDSYWGNLTFKVPKNSPPK